MFGLAGDDLTIVLFLAGLAATFAVAAMSQAGWKHWGVIGGLFVLAAVCLAAALGWPWLKEISPNAAAFAGRVAKNPASWFAVLILGLSAVLLISKNSRETTTQRRRRTGVSLSYTPGIATPVAANARNIWRWYSLLNGVIAVDQAGNKIREDQFWTIFLMLDQPIPAKQVVVTCSKGTLPQYEVKDFGNRHAIITFASSLYGLNLDIQILN